MIVDDIRSMTLLDFKKPLESHLMKNSTEWLALLIVSQCKADFPKFSCNDAPDLQSKDNQIGIEVAEAISKKDAQIRGLSSSYRNGKCRTDKWTDIVKKNGGKVALDGSNITYPTITSKDEWKTICEIYEKKLDKIISYRQKGFKKIGLIIICSDILLPVKKETMEKSMKDISEKFIEKYDFVFLVVSETFFEFNGYGDLTGYKKIEEIDLLKKCARLLAEKKIGIESIEKEIKDSF